MLLAIPGLRAATDARDASDQLPAAIEQPAARRTTGVSLFTGDDLFKHMNGGAGLYLKYGFEEVATADYSIDGKDMTVDIYRFTTAANAYGLYSMERPPEPASESIGIEGFSTGSGIVFVKGEYLVKLMSYSRAEETASLLRDLSGSIASSLPGTLTRPELFSHFPREGRIEYADKIHAEGYLGRQGLEYTYSMKCRTNGDTLALFLAEDQDHVKFERLSGTVQNAGPAGNTPGKLPFGEEETLLFEDSFYGSILIGTRSGLLVGIVGYESRFDAYIRKWVLSLPQNSPARDE